MEVIPLTHLHDNVSEEEEDCQPIDQNSCLPWLVLMPTGFDLQVTDTSLYDEFHLAFE